MSPNLRSRWTARGTVSSGFRDIEIGWDRRGDLWGPLPHFSPQWLARLGNVGRRLGRRRVASARCRGATSRGAGFIAVGVGAATGRPLVEVFQGPLAEQEDRRASSLRGGTPVGRAAIREARSGSML